MRRMVYLFIFCLFFTVPGWADAQYEPLLNQVNLQLNAEQWATTKTALVSVNVNASVSGTALDKIPNEVLKKLNELSNKGEWHIVSFNRDLDQSGLERVQILAQARLNMNDLGNLRDKAKALSVPGKTFDLTNIDFTPSQEETQTVISTLRTQIYNQVIAEIANLNKLYPDQKFYLHAINFSNANTMVPQPRAFFSKEANTAMVGTTAASNSEMTVGNKVVLNANVVLASAPNADVIKLVHN